MMINEKADRLMSEIEYGFYIGGHSKDWRQNGHYHGFAMNILWPVLDWVRSNIEGDFSFTPITAAWGSDFMDSFDFDDETDAMAFKLRWL